MTFCGDSNVVEEIKPLPGSVVQSLIEAHFFYYNKRFMAEVFPILDRIDWSNANPSTERVIMCVSV